MLKALQFHRITNQIQICGTWNFYRQFENFVRFIIENGYNVILPQSQGDGVIITFDDAEEGVYNYAFPILKKYRCPALVFLIVEYIGKKNTWDIHLAGRKPNHISWQQILAMKNSGISFGSHTMTHRDLTKLNKRDLEYEIFESKRILEERLGTIDSISYPFNRVNKTVLEAVKKAGYKFGFGGTGDNNLCIKKEAIYITDNITSLRTKISEKPFIFYCYERAKQKIINYFTIATILKMSYKI